MSAVDGWDAIIPSQSHPRYSPRNMPVRTLGVGVELQRSYSGQPTEDLVALIIRDRRTGDIQQRLEFTQAQALHIARVALQITEPPGMEDGIFDTAIDHIDECSRRLSQRRKAAQLAVDRDAVLVEAGFGKAYSDVSSPLQRMVDLVLEARS